MKPQGMSRSATSGGHSPQIFSKSSALRRIFGLLLLVILSENFRKFYRKIFEPGPPTIQVPRCLWLLGEGERRCVAVGEASVKDLLIKHGINIIKNGPTFCMRLNSAFLRVLTNKIPTHRKAACRVCFRYKIIESSRTGRIT